MKKDDTKVVQTWKFSGRKLLDGRANEMEGVHVDLRSPLKGRSGGGGGSGTQPQPPKAQAKVRYNSGRDLDWPLADEDALSCH